MKYTHFERLVIGAGALTIAATVLISFSRIGWSGWPELLAQLLLLPVLTVAVHYGRKAGLLAALIASVAFIVLKIPVLSAPAGLEPSELALIAFNIAAYGLVGIVGGDLCGRVKYFIGRHDQSASVDDWSHVYNQRKASELLENARNRFARYGEPFTVVVITQSPSAGAELPPAKQRTLARAVANYLRGDVRMIDEVARLEDGRFVVILPHTQRTGGLIVAERLAEGVRVTRGEEVDCVSASCLAAQEDDLELGSLAASISLQTAS